MRTAPLLDQKLKEPVHDDPGYRTEQGAERGEETHDEHEDKRDREPVLAAGRPEHFGNVLCSRVAPRALERVGEEHIQGQGRTEGYERPCRRADDDCFFKSPVAHEHLVNSKQ